MIRGDRVAKPGESELDEQVNREPPPGWRDRYSGTYHINGMEVQVYAEGDSLMANAPGQDIARLVYQGHSG